MRRIELSTGLRGSARQKARLIRRGRKISDLAVVPLADLFQQLHSTDAADPSYEGMASVSESLFGETGRGFDPDEGPIGRVGAGDERVEVAAVHDPPVTFWACTDGGDEAGSPAHREGSGHVVEQNEQEASMSKFVAIVFPNEEKIPEAVRTLRNMHGGKGIKLFGSAVVVRDPGGKLSVQEITKEGHGGAAVGALIGTLAGVLGGPLAATIAASGGAIVGELADLISQRADAGFVEKVSAELTPGKAAVVADVAEDGAPSFEAQMESIGGTAVRK